MNQQLFKLYQTMYRRAGTGEKLPWHRDHPPFLLTKAAQARTAGRALDIGCGAGSYSIWLAREGWTVTSVDFVPEALDLARKNADSAPAKIDFQQADILTWRPEQQFDLILDSGCFHTLKESEQVIYMENLSKWLAPEGDFLLVHFGKRNLFDWRPFGPRRRNKAEIERIFSARPVPGLKLIGSYSEVAKTVFPMGPSVQIITCWFRN